MGTKTTVNATHQKRGLKIQGMGIGHGIAGQFSESDIEASK
jgi:hypothetical protein